MVAPDARQPELRRATYDDLRRVPDHLVAEIIDGVLYTSPRPASPHAVASSSILTDLGPPFQKGRGGSGPGFGGWHLLIEPELHVPVDDETLVPDLAGWRREHMPVVPNVARFELFPDWVCEVVSPSTARLDRVKKMPVYARQKVGHVWLIDPLARTLEVFRLQEDRWMLAAVHGGAEKVRAEPFAAVELAMSDWWLPEEGETEEPAAEGAAVEAERG